MNEFQLNDDVSNANEFDSNFGIKKPSHLEDIKPNLNETDDQDRLMNVDPQNDPIAQLAGGADQLMQSISTRTIAKSLIPKVSVLKKALKSADVYIKFERILEEFNGMIYYNSVIEIITWIVGLICFFSYPSQMGWIWLHMLHIPRGVLGIYMVLKKTPKTYDLIENISDFQKDQLEEHWGFEKMSKHVRENFKKHIVNVLKGARTFYVTYFALSWINFALDCIGMLVQLIRFGSDGDEYSDLFMLAANIIFMYTFLSYAIWTFTFSFRLAPAYRKEAMKAAMGLTDGLVNKVKESITKIKGSTFVRNTPPTNPNNRGFGTNNNNNGGNTANGARGNLGDDSDE